MRYRHYKKAVEIVDGENELRRLLALIENDNEIDARVYESLRYRIIKKIFFGCV